MRTILLCRLILIHLSNKKKAWGVLYLERTYQCDNGPVLNKVRPSIIAKLFLLEY